MRFNWQDGVANNLKSEIYLVIPVAIFNNIINGKILLNYKKCTFFYCKFNKNECWIFLFYCYIQRGNPERTENRKNTKFSATNHNWTDIF